MERFSGDIYCIDNGQAEIFAGPVDQLTRQHLLPQKYNPASAYNVKTKFAVVVEYYMNTAAPDVFGYDTLTGALDKLAELEKKSAGKNKRYVDR